MGSSGRKCSRQSGSILDLIGIAFLTAMLALFLAVPSLGNTPLKPILALAFIFIAPGYTVTAALLPGHGVIERNHNHAYATARLDHTAGLLERVVFGFGSSVAITILCGLGLGLTDQGITAVRLFSALAAVTALGLPLALARRQQQSDENLLSIKLVRTRVSSKLSISMRSAKLVIATLTVAVLLIGVIPAGTGSGGQADATLTEMYLLSENDNGEFEAEGYPASLTPGEPESFAIGLSNQEGEQTDYTVVVALQAFEVAGDSKIPVSQTGLQRFDRTLEDGESTTIPHDVTLTEMNRTQDRQYRLTYFLYIGTAPDSPATNGAYREVHLWVEIDDSAGQSRATAVQ